MARREKKISALHLFHGIAIAHLGSVLFFGRGFNFFHIGKGTTQNKNLQRLFPLILYPLTSVRIKSKPTKKTTTHEVVDLRQMQLLGVARVLVTKE